MTLIRIRKAVSVIVLIGFFFLFAGPESVSVILSGILPPLQFTPALIRSLFEPNPIFISGLILIVAVTLVFGRVYCSFLCPLGTLQDLFGAWARRLHLQKDPSYTRPYNLLRYSILAGTAFAWSIGFLSFVNLLDPFAQTGKLFSNIVQPLLVQAYNLCITALKPFDIYFYPRQAAPVIGSSLALTVGFFSLIAFMSMKRGRLYCNTLCPVGTLLGLLSRISLFKWVVNPKGCSECVRCEKACKAQCIDGQAMSVDMSRCVGCFNCLDVCNKTAIRYGRTSAPAASPRWSPARRSFVLGGIAAAGGLLWGINPLLRQTPGTARAETKPPVTPPGSGNRARFTEACTACSLCVSACPTSVLTPAFMDYGPEGLLQPKLNYDRSFCDYECNICSKVCPTGAILPIGLDEKKLTQIAEARLLEDVCVVFVDHTNCGACGEVCPTHAIRFTDKNNILYPEIDTKYCIGCGACRLACPTAPKSIVIQAHPVHRKAEKYVPAEKPVESGQAADRDFPF